MYSVKLVFVLFVGINQPLKAKYFFRIGNFVSIVSNSVILYKKFTQFCVSIFRFSQTLQQNYIEVMLWKWVLTQGVLRDTLCYLHLKRKKHYTLKIFALPTLDL